MKKSYNNLRNNIFRTVITAMIAVCVIVTSVPCMTVNAADGKADTDESTFSPLERALYCDTLEFLNRIYNTNTDGNVSTEYICNLPKDCVIRGDTYQDVNNQIRAARDKVFKLIHTKYAYLCGWSYSSAYGTFRAMKGIDSDDDNVCSRVLFRWPVVSGYSVENADEPAYCMNGQKLKEYRTISENAMNVVKQYHDYSDYNKIKAYADWIAVHTSYDYEAEDIITAHLNGTLTESGDKVNRIISDHDNARGPWGMESIFDLDPETKSVCNAYSIAFQFLMDCSEFYDPAVHSIRVTGSDHAWNVVTIGGNNYFVDVTWYDKDSGRYDTKMLLGTQSVIDTLKSHKYGEPTLRAYTADELALSDTPYDPSQDPSIGKTIPNRQPDRIAGSSPVSIITDPSEIEVMKMACDLYMGVGDGTTPNCEYRNGSYYYLGRQVSEETRKKVYNLILGSLKKRGGSQRTWETDAEYEARINGDTDDQDKEQNDALKKKVKVSPQSIKIRSGRSKQINVKKNRSVKKVSYMPSDRKKIKISKNGKAKFLKKGTYSIRVRIAFTDNTVKTVRIPVKVK